MVIRRRALLYASRRNRTLRRRMDFVMRATGRRGRSNRLFRRFINRRAIRPELKWTTNIANAQLGNSIGSTALTSTTPLTPVTIGQGVGIGSRVGDQVKFVKIDVRTVLRDASGANNVTAPLLPDYLIRCIVWSPRVDITAATTNMNAMTIQLQVDYNIVTVISDRTYRLAPHFIGDTVSADPNTGALSTRVLYHKFKFPRKVKFAGNTIDLVDEEKFSCYMTFICDNLTGVGFTYNINSKTWYFDS